MKTNRVDEGVSGARKKRGKVPAAVAAAAEVVIATETETEAEIGKEVPLCPVEDPRYGDKTVAVVAWFKEYRPEEFVKRYAGRRFFRQD